MKLYLRLQDVPELRDLPPKQRSLVHRCCYQMYGATSWKTFVALMLYGLCGGVGMVGGKLLYPHLKFPLIFLLMAGTIVGGAIGFALYRSIVIGHLRQYYTDFIRNDLPKLGK